MLGGMLGWPGSAWEDDPKETPPASGDWRDLGAEVRHTFTHFHLRLAVRVAELEEDAKPKTGRFVPAKEFRPGDLPTVMRKAFDLAAASLVDS